MTKRIALVCRVHPSHRPGGMPFVFADRAAALARMGFDVHAITTADTARQARTAQISDGAFAYTLHYVGGKPREYSSEFATAAEECVKSLTPDVLHFDSLDFSRPWLAGRPGNPKCVAVTMHGFGAGATLTKWNMFRRSRAAAPDSGCWDAWRTESDVLRRHADKVIAISRHELCLLRTLYGTTQQQTRLVYNPISEAFFAPTVPVPDGCKDVVMAAISGHGERNFAWARDVLKAAGYTPRVMQDCPREFMPGVYDKALCVLVPTFYAQGYDLVVAEALARQRLAVCTAVGSYYAEAATGGGDNDGIVLFEPDDTDSLVQAVQTAQHRAYDGLSQQTNGSEKHQPAAAARLWCHAIF